MPPPRSIKTKPAQVAPQGKKKTFDDDEEDIELDFGAVASSSKRPTKSKMQADSDEDEDGDDSDDAPEAVGMSAGKSSALKQAEEAQRLAESKREAARARNEKIASARQKEKKKEEKKAKQASKSAGKKRKVEEDESEDEAQDEETRRLEARMKAAMQAGEGDSEDEGMSFHTDSEGDEEDEDEDDLEDEDDDDDEEDDEDEDEEGSFHTESEGDDEEDEDDSDDSETLEDGPIDAKTRLMYDRMQAAMEAAERRAGIVHPPKPAKPSSSLAAESSKAKSRSTVTASDAAVKGSEVEEENMWDMTAGTGGPQPLSAEALRRAEEAEEEAKRRKKQKDLAEAEKRSIVQDNGRKKKKQKVQEKTTKSLSGGKVVQLLKPTLDPSAGGLPPVMNAGSKLKGQAAGKDNKKKFMRRAMNASGQIPTKNRVDGRRKPMGLEARQTRL